MGVWDRKYSNGSFAGNWNGRLIYDLNSQNTGGNFSTITLTLQTFSDNSSYSQSGTWDPRIYINGGQVAGSTFSRTISNGASTMASWNGNIGHDANGNASINIGDYINAPVNEMTFAQIGWGLPRIAQAPNISSVIADTIKPVSARLGAEIGGYGHGTSATFEMFYRLQGSGTWISLGQQGDVGGYNYWYPTGLVPARAYEYIVNCFNNNGDLAQSGVQTFKTQSVPGMVPVLMGLL